MNALIINCSPVRTGATAEIVKIVAQKLSEKYETKCICIDDYHFSFCKGCRTCHNTAECIQKDDIPSIMNEFERADVPGQFKAFIDRCTPWCTHTSPMRRSAAEKEDMS